MNAEKYNAAEAHRLIESAHEPYIDARMETLLNESAEITALLMRRVERYQRRCRIMTAVSLALAGIVAALTVSR